MPDAAALYEESELTTPDGLRVARYTWFPAEGEPRAAVQIAHGAAEHARRYDRFARYLAAHGFAVLATDHRGHGRTAASTGGYGRVGAEGWRGTVWDLKAAGDRLRADHPRLPLVLLGHSMGSFLARDLAEDRGDAYAGLILSGAFRSWPGADPEGDAEALRELIGKDGRDAESTYLSDLFAAFNDPFEYRTGFEWLSRDTAEVDAYVADEACGFAFSAGLCLDLLRGARKINDPAQLGRIPSALPVHVVVGSEDPCHQGLTLVHELLEDFRYRGTRDLTHRIHEGARHEVLNETNRDEVQAGILEWLEKRF